MVINRKVFYNSAIRFLRKLLLNFRFDKNRNIYLSFGENCLTDEILKRYGIKSFSTPYSSARSNIEYILAMEKDSFKNFLNLDYLEYQILNNQKLPRLKTYNSVRNVYIPLHMNGFEFNHHDVIASNECRKTFERRYQRLLNLKNVNLHIFYHHRYCEKTNIEMLLNHLIELKKLYLNRCPNVEIIMFTQSIIDDISKRDLVYKNINGINFYEFKTINLWEGDNQDIFWARCDDDLIEKMINHVCRLRHDYNNHHKA